MLTSTYLLSTDKRLRSYLIGGLIAAIVAVGSVAYEVKPGDTLSGIAQKHGVSLQALLEANEFANPNLIRPGQEVVIPGSGGAAAQVHVVGKGETLASIAKKYSASISAIAKANDVPNPDLIRVGQKLAIPSGGGGGSAPSSATTAYHVVARGETLASIAAKYGVTAEAIAKANGISNPGLIYEGTRLALSGETFVADAAAGGAATAATHTVQAGETLDRIARKYGVSVSDIAKTNGIDNVDRIRAGAVLDIPGGGSWVCPVTGGSYINDWGFPRSDERFHQGTDIFAPRGTEVKAPVSGTVKLITGTIGGLQAYLYGSDGTTYIATHLDAFGRAGEVKAGQTIGYVGDTGNARGGPTHVHFEIHPGDGPAVNPYPTLTAAGC